MTSGVPRTRMGQPKPPTPPARAPSSSKPATAHTPGWRTASAPARTPASDTCRRPRSRSTEPVPGRHHRGRPAGLAAPALPRRPARGRRTENPALPAAAHRRPHRARPAQTQNPHPRNLALGNPAGRLLPGRVRHTPTNLSRSPSPLPPTRKIKSGPVEPAHTRGDNSGTRHTRTLATRRSAPGNREDHPSRPRMIKASVAARTAAARMAEPPPIGHPRDPFFAGRPVRRARYGASCSRRLQLGENRGERERRR